jgi:hypothetical protein
MFLDCTGLTSVTLGEGMTVIGKQMFNGCTSLNKVEFGSGVTEIGTGAFNGCTSLEQMTVPAGVAALEEALFYNCSSLKNVIIPDSVKEIRMNAFYGCDSLQTVYFTGTNEQWSDIYVMDGNSKLFDVRMVFNYSPENEHAYEIIVTYPTCTGEGYTTHTCVECGDIFISDELPALGHDFGNWTADKEVPGVERRICTRCGVTETRSTAKPEITLGDVNEDGRVNAKDVTSLMKYLVGNEPKVFNEAAADKNGDGKLNAKDVIALMKFIINQ